MTLDPYRTPRLRLPLLATAQANKDVTYNEALTLVDGLLDGTVQGLADAPPIDPAPGQAWLVGAVPTGDWAGYAHALALWTAGGWRFVQMPMGARRWDHTADALRHRNDDGWSMAPIIAAPTGGATVDTECRAVIVALINALSTHGLVRA